ncbi:MAG TPA: 50S ribosomal protein L9 [bacterium]
MKVILLKELEKHGKPYDTIEVKKGFARNYLFPRKIAIEATPGNIKGLKKSLERFSQQAERIRRKSMSLAEKINTLTLKTTIKMGIDGKSFGSITSQNLVDMVNKEEIEINKKWVSLDEPIKHPGIYDVEVNLPEKVKAIFKLVVVAEGEEGETEKQG